MSNKNDKRKRNYTLRERARRRAEVHRRITLAAVQLHGSIGPARTTIREIAKLAGVRRATVYNHFPTDGELIDACSSHWFSENPPPDPVKWAVITEPRRRAEVALEALYRYYHHGHEMLGRVLRDWPQVPALEEILRLKWWPMLEMMAGILAQGWNRAKPGGMGETLTESQRPPIQGENDLNLHASIKVALDFFTWETMIASGLSNEKAAGLAVTWIASGSDCRPMVSPISPEV